MPTKTTATHWRDAWLHRNPAPPRTLPPALQLPAVDLLDFWLLRPNGPLRQIALVAPQADSYEIMNGLLYCGFARYRDGAERIEPIPVIYQILYGPNPPGDSDALVNVVVMQFSQTFRAWAELHRSGQPYCID